MHHSSCSPARGFTLIELSIVLVVIGLVVGGVLVGQDLTKAAAIRATISQIEKYQTAVNTFRTKYGALPGDVSDPAVTQFGFVARAGGRGRGDNNGIIEGYNYNSSLFYGWNQNGETFFFWEDLSSAGFIDRGFSTATDANNPGVGSSSTPGFDAFIPSARLGAGNYFFVYSIGWSGMTTVGVSYFGLAAPVTISGTGNLVASPGLTVAQAYNIDRKIDDGFPLVGRVTTQYITGGSTPATSPNAALPSATTCYDTSSNQYSMSQNSGAGINCALSFQLQ